MDVDRMMCDGSLKCDQESSENQVKQKQSQNLITGTA